jgi:hypothetical protein
MEAPYPATEGSKNAGSNNQAGNAVAQSYGGHIRRPLADRSALLRVGLPICSRVGGTRESAWIRTRSHIRLNVVPRFKWVGEKPMMASLAVISTMVGVLLGLTFRVLALIPVAVLVLIALATIGAGSEAGVCWMIAFDVAIITALEAGYLGGSAVVALVE